VSLPTRIEVAYFVSQDAAYLVEAAAVARTLPRLASRTGDARALVRSGAVLVHGEEYRRWKDGRRWTDGRNLGNGFSLYRELATDDADRMSQEDLVSLPSPSLRDVVFVARLQQYTGIKTDIKHGSF